MFIIKNISSKFTFTFTRFVPFYMSCFISSKIKYFDIYVFYNIRDTNFCIRIIDIITTTTTFTCFNTKWKNTGSSPLTLTTWGLVLDSRLLIVIQINEFAFVTFDKIVNPTKISFYANPKIFIHTMLYFFIKYL